jgi:nucleoside phosphorylase
LLEDGHYTNTVRNAILGNMKDQTKSRAHVTPRRWCVVSAWRPELARLRAKLTPTLRRELTLASVGVGLVEAAVGTARLIAEHHPGAILLVGTAGLYPGENDPPALRKAAAVDGMVLLPQVLAGGHAYLPDLVPGRARTTPALTRALCRAAKLSRADVACPLAITSSARAASTARRLSGCMLENLECFAVARAAASAGVPFAAVLGIANHVGAAGHREWKRHARGAAAAACDAVLALLEAAAQGAHSTAPP